MRSTASSRAKGVALAHVSEGLALRLRLGCVATPMLDMLLPANAYQRHGTSVRVRILVFDKGRTVIKTATPANLDAVLRATAVIDLARRCLAA